MTLLLAGMFFGALLAWFVRRAQGSGATTEAVLPMDPPRYVDSAALALSMRRRRSR